MVFVVLRQQSRTMQGLVVVEPELVSKKMVRWVEGIHDESIVLVEGVLQTPKEPIKSCTVHDVELKIRKVGFLCGGGCPTTSISPAHDARAHRSTSSRKRRLRFRST
jgi:aspartyl/asparaginyl-tRNA synthetase